MQPSDPCATAQARGRQALRKADMGFRPLWMKASRTPWSVWYLLDAAHELLDMPAGRQYTRGALGHA